MSVARYRERHSTSGAKSDAADAHVLAEIVRLDRAHHRPVAGDCELSEAIKLVGRSHQSLIWDRTRHVLRLRGVLRESFPAAMRAGGNRLDLDNRSTHRPPARTRTCGGTKVVVNDCSHGQRPAHSRLIEGFGPPRGRCRSATSARRGP
jgi:transposase